MSALIGDDDEMRKKVKLKARIDLGIDIELPDKSVPLSVITPNGMLSEEAIVEIEDDLVYIQFSTALGKVGLTISPSDLEKVLQAAKEEP